MSVPYPLTRRQVLSRLGGGFGGLALGALLADTGLSRAAAGKHDLAEKKPQYPAKAKAVIQLFMHGGPSHVDLLDPKPMPPRQVRWQDAARRGRRRREAHQ